MTWARQDTWPTPNSRSLGKFTDLTLFYEALELADERQTISSDVLEAELSQRLQGLQFVEKQSRSAAKDLIRELQHFYWITPTDGYHRRPSDKYILTSNGRAALQLYKQGKKREFLRLLTEQMQRLYVIPGWFVTRLWEINPQRQGEVVIPTPPRDWNPQSRRWAAQIGQKRLQSKQIVPWHL